MQQDFHKNLLTFDAPAQKKQFALSFEQIDSFLNRFHPQIVLKFDQLRNNDLQEDPSVHTSPYFECNDKRLGPLFHAG